MHFRQRPLDVGASRSGVSGGGDDDVHRARFETHTNWLCLEKKIYDDLRDFSCISNLVEILKKSLQSSVKTKNYLELILVTNCIIEMCTFQLFD